MTAPTSPMWERMKALRRAAYVESLMLRAEIGTPRSGWAERAECAGCRRFTHELCNSCPVMLDCLRAAHRAERGLDLAGVVGTRGGCTEAERASWYRTHPLHPINRAAPFAQLVLDVDGAA